MRLLVIGGFSAFDSLGTVVRALQRRPGLEVRYLATHALRYEVGPGGKIDRMTSAQAAEEVVKAASGWADAVLAWQVKQELDPYGFARLKGQVRLVWWTIDDPYLLRTEASPYRDLADLVLSCSCEAVSFSRCRGQQAELVWPAADPEAHGAACHYPPVEYLADFAFCATNGYERALYPRVRAERREMARAVRPLGRVDLWGVWKDPDLADLVRGWKCYEELGAVFATAKVNLNNHVLPDAVGYLNQRVLEICGSGGFQLVDDCAGLGPAGFEPGEHLVTWHNLEDLVPKARYYLEHEAERVRIAAAGREFALREHGADRWAERFVALVRGLS